MIRVTAGSPGLHPLGTPAPWCQGLCHTYAVAALQTAGAGRRLEAQVYWLCSCLHLDMSASGADREKMLVYMATKFFSFQQPTVITRALK